jgi:hypothetical protein
LFLSINGCRIYELLLERKPISFNDRDLKVYETTFYKVRGSEERSEGQKEDRSENGSEEQSEQRSKDRSVERSDDSWL